MYGLTRSNALAQNMPITIASDNYQTNITQYSLLSEKNLTKIITKIKIYLHVLR